MSIPASYADVFPTQPESTTSPAEQLIWEDRPAFWPFFLTWKVVSIVVATVALISYSAILYPHATAEIALVLGLLCLTLAVFTLPMRFLAFKRTVYKLYASHLYVRPLLGIHEDDEIDKANIEVLRITYTPLERMTGRKTGTIWLPFPRNFHTTLHGQLKYIYYPLSNVSNPEEVAKLLQSQQTT